MICWDSSRRASRSRILRAFEFFSVVMIPRREVKKNGEQEKQGGLKLEAEDGENGIDFRRQWRGVYSQLVRYGVVMAAGSWRREV